jgi:hypothetical protein
MTKGTSASFMSLEGRKEMTELSSLIQTNPERLPEAVRLEKGNTWGFRETLVRLQIVLKTRHSGSRRKERVLQLRKRKPDLSKFLNK